jgi:hypothetical protein
MNDGRLTAGDVVEITGIPFNSLDRWITNGWLNPAQSDRGSGYHRSFGPMEVFAILVGIRYRDEGATEERFKGIVRFLASTTVEVMEENFAAGRTFPVPAQLLFKDVEEWMPGEFVAPPYDQLSTGAAALMRKLDLVLLWTEAQAKIKRALAKPRPKAGRPPKQKTQLLKSK